MGLVAIHSGHIGIFHKYTGDHATIYLAQKPKQFWSLVTFSIVAGVIFIFQAIRGGSDA
jgi:hypothetical protein